MSSVRLALPCLLLACNAAAPADATVEIPDDVQRAFDESCATEQCHDATTRSEGLSLDAAHSAAIVEGPSAQSELPLVRLGSLGESYMAIKLLPSAQLPAGAERLEEPMPLDGYQGNDVDNVNAILAWIAGHGPHDADTAAGGSTTSGDGGESGGGTTSAEGDGSTSSPSPDTNSGGGPAGPRCSVEEVTEGTVLDPVDKGDEAGKLPTVVGEALEDNCGCHTLADRELNTEFPFLLPPSNSLFLQYSDLARPIAGSTLGAVMEEQIFGNGAMPPGSCPGLPDDDAAVLEKWFFDGMPDGAGFEPP